MEPNPKINSNQMAVLPHVSNSNTFRPLNNDQLMTLSREILSQENDLKNQAIIRTIAQTTNQNQNNNSSHFCGHSSNFLKSIWQIIIYSILIGTVIGLLIASYNYQDPGLGNRGFKDIILNFLHPIIEELMNMLKNLITNPLFYVPILSILVIALSTKAYFVHRENKLRRENMVKNQRNLEESRALLDRRKQALMDNYRFQMEISQNNHNQNIQNPISIEIPTNDPVTINELPNRPIIDVNSMTLPKIMNQNQINQIQNINSDPWQIQPDFVSSTNQILPNTMVLSKSQPLLIDSPIITTKSKNSPNFYKYRGISMPQNLTSAAVTATATGISSTTNTNNSETSTIICLVPNEIQLLNTPSRKMSAPALPPKNLNIFENKEKVLNSNNPSPSTTLDLELRSLNSSSNSGETLINYFDDSKIIKVGPENSTDFVERTSSKLREDRLRFQQKIQLDEWL